MKLNNMPTNRLRINFLKTAFLNILKYAIKLACLYVCYHGPIPNKPTTCKFLQRSFGKTKSSEKISVSKLIVVFVTVNFYAIA